MSTWCFIPQIVSRLVHPNYKRIHLIPSTQYQGYFTYLVYKWDEQPKYPHIYIDIPLYPQLLVSSIFIRIVNETNHPAIGGIPHHIGYVYHVYHHIVR